MSAYAVATSSAAKNVDPSCQSAATSALAVGVK